MNERIRELAEQAGFNPYNYEGANASLFKKFAESIVRECAEVASEPLAFTDAAYCRVGLLKHFGIEE